MEGDAIKIFIVNSWGLAETIQNNRPSWSIALRDPGCRKWGDDMIPEAKRLRVECHDVNLWPCPDKFVPPQQSHIQQIISFARKHQHEDAVVSCYAGQSRSVGVGLVIAAAIDPSGIRRRVLQMPPWVSPNRLIIRFGDQLLGLRGTLVSAVHIMGEPTMRGGKRSFSIEL